MLQFFLKITDIGNTKMIHAANQPLHLNLLFAIKHYAFFDVDVKNKKIYVSIMTHQPKQASLLNSKAPNLIVCEENIQQLRTNFVLEIKDTQTMSELINILQNEQIITLQELKKYGNLHEVTQNMNNVRQLISYNDSINLTNTGENIEKIESYYKLNNSFRALQQGYLEKRIPVDVHPKLRNYFLQSEKEYKQYGMSDIKRECDFASEMCKILETSVSPHGIFSGTTTAMSPKLAHVIRSDIGALIRIAKKFIKKIDDLD